MYMQDAIVNHMHTIIKMSVTLYHSERTVGTLTLNLSLHHSLDADISLLCMYDNTPTRA